MSSNIQTTEATAQKRNNRNTTKHDEALLTCMNIVKLLNEHAGKGEDYYGVRQAAKRQYQMTKEGRPVCTRMEAAALRNFMSGYATALVA